MLVAALAAAGLAGAAETTIVGPVTKIELAADGKSAVATLKDGKSGADVAIVVTDDLTLDKFKDKRIVEGDEIRTRFDNAGGKNSSKAFKKTAGC
jgi:hypothetical protein